MASAPVALMLPFMRAASDASPWNILLASSASMGCFITGLTLFRKPQVGKSIGSVALCSGFLSTFPHIADNPFAALMTFVIFAGLLHKLTSFEVYLQRSKSYRHVDRCLQRAWWATLVVPLIVVIAMLIVAPRVPAISFFISGSFLIAHALVIHWSWNKRDLVRLSAYVLEAGILCASLVLFSEAAINLVILLLSLTNLLSLPLPDLFLENREQWWEVFVNHPARILLSTFSLLCLSGAILLQFPFATTASGISFVDAAFTAVSAVCVTGLVVLDTPHDFTFIGQLLILGLIQLGGIGIMSIATVALHAIGHRLSLKQEYLLTSITETNHTNLFQSLGIILKFTFAVETCGACFLALLFSKSGLSWPQAIWQGVFTSVSAFCNAGFALNTDSLVSFQNNPLVLYVVAALIILGGMAPPTSLAMGRLLRAKTVPVSAYIALVTSFVLLASGTIFFLAFEWNGALVNMTVMQKIHNSWFQSATLRTAGFNSIEIAHITNPMIIIMVIFMFIGGSPGGTAGGIKTTTVGILAMTFWVNITNREQVIIKSRRISQDTINRAITIVASGLLTWFAIVLMLGITQKLATRDIIFEATSALATVGLSTNTTSRLDEIGKVIIIFAMFIGRVGPMTLFMLLGDDRSSSPVSYPEAKISLS